MEKEIIKISITQNQNIQYMQYHDVKPNELYDFFVHQILTMLAKDLGSRPITKDEIMDEYLNILWIQDIAKYANNGLIINDIFNKMNQRLSLTPMTLTLIYNQKYELKIYSSYENINVQIYQFILGYLIGQLLEKNKQEDIFSIIENIFIEIIDKIEQDQLVA